MDNFNKVISFILGLVVVIVFFGIISGRINLRGKFPFLTKSATPTQTPTQSIKITPTPISTVKISPPSSSTNQAYNRYQKTPSSIPATGSPTIFLPILFSSMAAGFYLKNKGKK
ncbi:MAG: hypothetical protein ACK4FL_00595 [Microgenomates group bacterium]